ncbi:MAG: hypothetical protein FJY88_04650 [Candidatus Eisenbacteria bacterium]|nr:hypothetical protein [Candidatus Eisenbacteria bacterium]
MKRIPLFPLDLALFPGEEIRLHIFEPRYRKMIGRCVQESLHLVIVRYRDGVVAKVGAESRIERTLKRYPDGKSDILLQALERIAIGPTSEHEDGYLEGEVAPIQEESEQIDHGVEDRLDELYRKYADVVGDVPVDPPPRGLRWSFRLGARFRPSIDLRQEMLEMTSENARLKRLLGHVEDLIPWLEKREKGSTLIKGNGRLHPDLLKEKP